ncbi:hypothetical protein [Microbacterium sp. SORGH_AS_0862]|uniref:hypothetical protein n=1 Tax=Microbacterium sp. SORGH_AS_0862 TaxID=3041789 RepID=UPI00278E427E|nr:hypothetical protein [Microbacterium sp. SORGH_AS_0862]MDQ1206087.1 TRAP-type C4-dicarboxylate transport system permease small subunit [Microbacterium sp. SORGH_AS_0862]
MSTEEAPQRTADWPRLRYWLLWLIAVAAVIAGLVLLSTSETTVWTRLEPTSETYEASTLSLIPVGSVLLIGGALLAVVLLILDTYVGPTYRRRK